MPTKRMNLAFVLFFLFQASDLALTTSRALRASISVANGPTR